MKRIFGLLGVVVSCCMYASAYGAMESEDLPLGSNMPAFDLKEAGGTSYSNESFADARAVVLVITCNHCPYAQASWPALTSLQDEFSDRNVQFVAINPNDSEMFPEDSFEKMESYKEKYAINFPYLRDETQELAATLGAVCTPDIFVYDSDHKLYYHGRINDSWNDPSNVTEESLKKALVALLNGEAPPEEQKPSFGCSIKWK